MLLRGAVLTEEITLKEYLTQRLDTLEGKVDENRRELREDVNRMVELINRERCSLDDCQRRCDARRNEIWKVIDELRLSFAQGLGREQGKSDEHTSAHTMSHLHWAKMLGAFTLVYVIIQALQLIVSYIKP